MDWPNAYPHYPNRAVYSLTVTKPNHLNTNEYIQKQRLWHPVDKLWLNNLGLLLSRCHSGFGFLNQLLKGSCVINSHVGNNTSVKHDAPAFQSANQL